jgi:hypothetical protein
MEISIIHHGDKVYGQNGPGFYATTYSYNVDEKIYNIVNIRCGGESSRNPKPCITVKLEILPAIPNFLRKLYRKGIYKIRFSIIGYILRTIFILLFILIPIGFIFIDVFPAWIEILSSIFLAILAIIIMVNTFVVNCNTWIIYSGFDSGRHVLDIPVKSFELDSREFKKHIKEIEYRKTFVSQKLTDFSNLLNFK